METVIIAAVVIGIFVWAVVHKNKASKKVSVMVPGYGPEYRYATPALAEDDSQIVEAKPEAKAPPYGDPNRWYKPNDAPRMQTSQALSIIGMVEDMMGNPDAVQQPEPDVMITEWAKAKPIIDGASCRKNELEGLQDRIARISGPPITGDDYRRLERAEEQLARDIKEMGL